MRPASEPGFRAIGEAGFEPATARPPAGGRRCPMRPDASHERELAEGEIARASDFTAAQNHDALAEGGRARGPLSSIEAPTS